VRSLGVKGNLSVGNVLHSDVSKNFVGINNNSPKHEFDVTGDIHCTGTLFADSDVNVKTNLVKLENVLDKIVSLNGYYYNKINEKESLKQIGVIAQEIEKEYPELVSTNIGEMKSVNYQGINAILIECVKDLRKENIEMKKVIEDIRKEIASIPKKRSFW
jgi:hypothetical protein